MLFDTIDFYFYLHSFAIVEQILEIQNSFHTINFLTITYFFLVAEKNKSEKNKDAPAKDEPSSIFQRQRVDMLLGDLLRKFPLPLPHIHQQQSQSNANQNAMSNTNINSDELFDNGMEINNIKQEPADDHGSSNRNASPNLMAQMNVKDESRSDMKPPPEKK